jgi:hypothetical protein
MNVLYLLPSVALLSVLIVSCQNSKQSDDVGSQSVEKADDPMPSPLVSKSDLGVSLKENKVVNNPYAYIPAQCYTKTRADGKVHNPCFSCHTVGKEPNYIDDSEFQLAYAFRETTRQNAWTNLFKDRSQAMANISDAEIVRYVNQSNYFLEDGKIELAERLKDLPASWDFDGNGKWEGYVPDCHYNFDSEGFDRDANGQDTGWRAFAYTPFLGTFWPTNGSLDDVLIRLPKAMREDDAGNYDRAVYNLNLSIVLAMIQRKNIVIDETDERVYNVDLNKNGQLDVANEIVYDWAPIEGRTMSYVGKAKALQAEGKLHLAAGLYPEGTEFLHTVRYLGIKDNDQVVWSPRIKELRYGKKLFWNNYYQLKNATLSEIKEVDAFPDRLRTVKGDAEFGLSNGVGWIYQGFIENAEGRLRPQNFEETLACIGCHSGTGATTDSSYAFPRKLDSSHFQNGWFHWSQKGIQGIKEPKYSDGSWQYTEYLLNNQSANEFRNNSEVMAKFWDDHSQLKVDQVERLHQDVAHLLMPSTERAKQLNKAYKIIVDEQSYIYGRDAHIEPLDETVWKEVLEDELTGVETPVIKSLTP